MPDVFNRETSQFRGSFSADGSRLTFPNVLGFNGQFAGDFGLLVQQLGVNYQQQVTRLYEVGSPAIYYIGGRTAGDFSMNRVVGPRSLQQVFYQKYGDLCQAAQNDLAFSATAGCGTSNALGGGIAVAASGSAAFRARFCVITSLGLRVNAADSIIAEQLNMMFSSLDYTTSGVAV